MIDLTLNASGIILSVIAYMALGMLWYSPLLFGRQWLKHSGLAKKKNVHGQMKKALIVSVVCAAVTAALLNVFIESFGVTDIVSALILAFMFWTGFTMPVMTTSYAYNHKSFSLLLIDAGYPLVYMLIMGIILVTL